MVTITAEIGRLYREQLEDQLELERIGRATTPCACPSACDSPTVGGNVPDYKGLTMPKRHTPPASDRFLVYGPPFARSRLPPAVALDAPASCDFPLHLLHFDRGVECAPSPYGTSGFKSSRLMGALPCSTAIRRRIRIRRSASETARPRKL